MTQSSRGRERPTAHVSRTQAAKEADAFMQNRGRSQWIATVIIIAILGLGAWVIAQRIMPYAMSSRLESVGSDGAFVQVRDAEPMAIAVDEVQEVAMPKVKMLSVTGLSSDTVDVSYDGGDVQQDRKIQRTGNIAIVVESASTAVERISGIAREYGGSVMQTHFATDERERVSGTIRIRVVAERFDEVLRKIKDIATLVKYERTQAQDVTEQYVDLKAQLKNKRVEEEEFQKLLASGGKLDDIIAVTRQLSRVRGEVERLEGRLRYMDARTEYSTITIAIEEDEKVVAPDTAWRPATVARQSLNRLVADAQEMVDNAIRFLVWFLPSFLAYVVVIVVLWRVVKRIGGAIIRRWERRQKNRNAQ